MKHPEASYHTSRPFYSIKFYGFTSLSRSLFCSYFLFLPLFLMSTFNKCCYYWINFHSWEKLLHYKASNPSQRMLTKEGLNGACASTGLWLPASCDHQSSPSGHSGTIGISSHLSSSPEIWARREALVFSCDGFLFGSPRGLSWTRIRVWTFTQEEVLPGWDRLFHRHPISCLEQRNKINLPVRSAHLNPSWRLFIQVWCQVQINWGL